MDILTKSYVTRRHLVSKEAHKRGTSIEQVVAEAITQKVMGKVDEEYL